MNVFDEEILEKFRMLPLESQKMVLDELAKILAARPHRFSEELPNSNPGKV